MPIANYTRFMNILFMYGIVPNSYCVCYCYIVYVVVVHILRCRIKTQSTTAISNAREKRFRAQTLDFRASVPCSQRYHAHLITLGICPRKSNTIFLALHFGGRVDLSSCLPSFPRARYVFTLPSPSPLSLYLHLSTTFSLVLFASHSTLRYCHFLLLPSACTRRVSRDYRQSLDFSIFASRCTKSVVRAKRPGTTKYQNFLDLLLSLRKDASYLVGFAVDKALNFRITISCFLHPISFALLPLVTHIC